MKIVVLDSLAANPGDCSWDAFEKIGALTVYDTTPQDKVAERIGSAEIVLTSLGAPVTREHLDACPQVRCLGVMSSRYNYCDMAAARERGILVCNIPSYGPYTVAQFAMALLLEICSQVGHHSREVRKGRWGKAGYWVFWDYPMFDLTEKTMGFIGLGRIGKYAARMAKSFGMNILAYDPCPDEEGAKIAEYVELDDLLAESDVISLHASLLDSNRGMINKESIAKMKDGVIIINTARGALIDEKDLAGALDSGKVYAAGLDSTVVEPVEDDNPLLNARNCFITPHIAWATRESRQRLIDQMADNVRAFLAGKPINVVGG